MPRAAIDLAATSRRNAEVVVAMGMSARLLTDRWIAANEKYLAGNQRAADIAGGLGAISKVLRMTLQSAVLGVGAYLVIHQEATAGVIIAGSILSARALAPVDLAIAHWRGFIAARQSWHRLNGLLEQLPVRAEQTLLQAPSSRLSVETISIVPPGDQKVIVQEVSFVLEAGQRRPGIIGPRTGVVAGARAGRRMAAVPRQGGGSTAPRSINGRRRCSAVTLAICRRTSNCSPAPWRRTFPVSIPKVSS